MNTKFVLVQFLSEDWDSPPAGFTRRPMVLPVQEKLAVEGWLTVAVERPVCPFTTWFTDPMKLAQKLIGRRRLRMIRDGFCLTTPVLALHERLADRVGAVRRLNGKLLDAQVSSSLRKLGVENLPRVLWLFHPVQSWIIDAVQHDALIYECYDEYAGLVQDEAYKEHLHRLEAHILANADLVLTTSAELHTSRSRLNPRTVMVNNGVDYDLFVSGANMPEPDDIASIPHPRIGFAGIMNSRLDYDLLDDLAAAHPEWNLLMIGPVGGIAKKDSAHINRLDNVHFLGTRPQSQLPAYLGHCDVNIIPYAKNESTAAVYPLKLNEYLAVGHPVVTTDFSRDLVEYKDVVRIAEDSSAFITAVADALLQTAGSVGAQMLARKASWHSRADQIVDAINQHVALECGGLPPLSSKGQTHDLEKVNGDSRVAKSGSKLPHSKGVCAVIIAKNEENRLPGCIETLRWCDAIQVVDSGSTDGTMSIARLHGAQVVELPFEGFSTLRNKAMDTVPESFEWIFFVDADERVSPELRDQILEVCARNDEDYSAWTVSRHNYLLGQWIKHSGWHPDDTPRLFRRGRVRYGQRLVHEEPIIDGKLGSLSGAMDHYSYQSTGDLLRKLDLYSDLEAKAMSSRMVEPVLWRKFPSPRFFHSVCKRIYDRCSILRPPMLFAYYYFFKLGILDGYRGFLIAMINGLFHGVLTNARIWERKMDEEQPVRRLRKCA